MDEKWKLREVSEDNIVSHLSSSMGRPPPPPPSFHKKKKLPVPPLIPRESSGEPLPRGGPLPPGGGWMKALGYLSALAAAVILACSNPAGPTPQAVPPPSEPAVPKPPELPPPRGALTLVYGTNNRIQVTRGSRLAVRPTLTPRAAKVKYSTEGAPDWLNIHPDLGVISADARRIQGAFSSADPSGLRQDFRFRILAAGIKGAHAQQSVTADLVLTVNSVSLPAVTYPARTVSRGGDAAARTISAAPSGGLTAAQADFAFDAATPPPAWLTLSDTGTIAGEVPANADTAAYTINVTGKGSYVGAADQAEFVLTVNSVPLPGMSYAAKTVSRAGDTAARTLSVPLTNGLPATQADYAFEPPSSKPAWLSIGETGTISGEVPTNATLGSTAYTVKVTGKGIYYAGKTGNVTFSLNVNVNDFDTLTADWNRDLQGIWSDGTTMWLADRGTSEKIYAYNMSTKARDSVKDFNALNTAGNWSSEGIWSDGTTMWVADRISDKIYAYSMSTKARDSAKDFDTLSAAGNNLPLGIWSDGATMWVADVEDDKIYAYSMSSKARESTKDFDTLIAAGNSRPTGLWSDGTTMWVVNSGADKIYAYSMSTKARTP